VKPQDAALKGNLGSDTYKRMSLGLIALSLMILELHFAHRAALTGGLFSPNALIGWVTAEAPGPVRM
jgi:hypothetical protein